MQGHVTKRGKSWSLVLDVGDEPARYCTAPGTVVTRKMADGSTRERVVRHRVWVDECTSNDCPTCGAPLEAPELVRRQRTIGSFRTRKDAESELRKKLGTIESGRERVPEKIALGEYLERWLAHRAEQVRPTTLRRYRQLLTAHVVPEIGAVELARVRPTHVQQVHDAMLAKGLAPATRLQCHATLGATFRTAQEWGLVPTNPVRAVRRPRVDRAPSDVPTVEELHRLLDAASGTCWEVPLVLAMASGARRGEVLALRWADLDLTTGRLRITRSLQAVDGTLRFVEPKTDRARREVTLPVFALEALKRHRTAQTQRRLRLGEGWVDGDLINDRGDGGPLHPDSFSTAFKRLTRKVGLPKRTHLHDVRHTFATMMLAEGVHPAIASSVLGHANPALRCPPTSTCSTG